MKYRNICLIALALLLLCGCDAQEPEGPVELWIVTEKTDRFGMNDQAEKLTTRFEEAHEDVTIRLETIPTDEEERDAYLEQLRTAIMAGEGPDVYLLPVRPYRSAEELFPDVTQSMYNGIFCDISEYYNNDTELNADGLVTAVMDAGTIGDARYVLPLRYDLPVAYVDEKKWAEAGISAKIVNAGFYELRDTVIASGDKLFAGGCVCWDVLDSFAMNVFPETVDYEKQEVTLRAEDVAALLTQQQEISAMVGDYPPYTITYFGGYCFGSYWADHGYSMYIGSLTDAMLNTAVAKLEEIDLEMYPVASSDGTVVADVTYFCAVGAGCEYPELAYEYLRQFLTEEAQWEEIRRDTNGIQHTGYMSGLIENGWPVRAVGGTSDLWNRVKSQHTGYTCEGAKPESRRKRLLKVWLEDEDLPILQAEIDTARFSGKAEAELLGLLWDVIDAEKGFTPTDVDINALAEEFIANLRWQVAEG